MSEKIQKTQEALVNSHMRTIAALKSSLQELQAEGLIRPFRISLAVSKDQENEIKQLHQEGKSKTEIAAQLNLPRETVRDKINPGARRKKSNNSNSESRRTPGSEIEAALAAAKRVAAWTDVTEEIVNTAYAVAQAWQRTADHLKEALNG